MRKPPLCLLIGTCLIIFIVVIAYWTILPRTATLDILGEGVYTGQLRGMTFHGQGRWESAFGITYNGEFRNGSFQGFGILTYANGAIYEGEFRDGHMHGYGVMIFPDGHMREGYWDSNEFLGDHEDCDHEL